MYDRQEYKKGLKEEPRGQVTRPLNILLKDFKPSLQTMESYEMLLNRAGTSRFSLRRMALAKVWRVDCRI